MTPALIGQQFTVAQLGKVPGNLGLGSLQRSRQLADAQGPAAVEEEHRAQPRGLPQAVKKPVSVHGWALTIRCLMIYGYNYISYKKKGDPKAA
jgi:hypothetical protein